MIHPDRRLHPLLDDAAAVLLAAGCADPFATTPALRLRCLYAGKRLQAVGARPSRSPTESLDDLPGAVILAILVLALLANDPEVSTDARLDAQDALRVVLVELG